MCSPLVKDFSIFNAWGDKRLTELKFRKNVTFITGFNGTGKTTLLELLNFSLSDPMSIPPNYHNWCTKILLKNKIALFSFDMGVTSERKQNKINAGLRKIKDKPQLEDMTLTNFYNLILKDMDAPKHNQEYMTSVVSNKPASDVDTTTAGRIMFSRNDNPQRTNDVKDLVSPIYYREEVFIDSDRPYTNHPDNKKTNIYDKSILLDFTLKELLIDFLSKEKELALSDNQKKNNSNSDSVFKEINTLLSGRGIDEDVAFKLKENFLSLTKKDDGYKFEVKEDVVKKFENVVDDFFECTDKKVCRDSRGLLALKDKKSNTIESSNLSRGEKNVLILLILAFLSRDEKKVFILDEPDLTLHIEWQKKIVAKLLELAPKSQFIIATHSPALFMNNIDFDVINMMDVTYYE